MAICIYSAKKAIEGGGSISHDMIKARLIINHFTDIKRKHIRLTSVNCSQTTGERLHSVAASWDVSIGGGGVVNRIAGGGGLKR